MKKLTEQELADKWIKELSEAGYTPDDMIAVFQQARISYEAFKKRRENKPKSKTYL